jgi:hypothetical protein
VGIFGKRRAQRDELSTWQPAVGYGVQNDSAREIAGDAAVAQTAYRLHFALRSAPSATLVIWTYAVTATPEAGPGPYAVGYRGECWIEEFLVSAWNEEDWEGYSNPADADAAALAIAVQLCTQRRGQPGEIDSLGFFEWDGVPF